MSMTLISVNVGRPIEVPHGGKTVTTGIFKQPVQGPVIVGKLNLVGDGQADLVNHGGESKAVYAYALEHYVYWQQDPGPPVDDVRPLRRKPHHRRTGRGIAVCG